MSAQSVRDSLPELVHEDPATGQLSVDYAGLSATLLGSVNELRAQVEQLANAAKIAV